MRAIEWLRTLACIRLCQAFTATPVNSFESRPLTIYTMSLRAIRSGLAMNGGSHEEKWTHDDGTVHGNDQMTNDISVTVFWFLLYQEQDLLTDNFIVSNPQELSLDELSWQFPVQHSIRMESWKYTFVLDIHLQYRSNWICRAKPSLNQTKIISRPPHFCDRERCMYICIHYLLRSERACLPYVFDRVRTVNRFME